MATRNLAKNTNGILDIIEAQKVVAGMGGMHTDGRISYDMNRTVPLSIHEESIGTGMNMGVSFIDDYSLIADSLAPVKP